MVCNREDEYVVLVDAIDDRVRKSAEHVSVCSVLDRPPAGLLRNEIHGCPDGGREVDAEVTAMILVPNGAMFEVLPCLGRKTDAGLTAWHDQV